MGDFGEFWPPPCSNPVENVPGPTDNPIKGLRGGIIWYD